MPAAAWPPMQAAQLARPTARAAFFTAKATIEPAHRPDYRRGPRSTNASGRKPAIRARDGRAHALARRAGEQALAGTGLVVGTRDGRVRRARADARQLVLRAGPRRRRKLCRR